MKMEIGDEVIAFKFECPKYWIYIMEKYIGKTGIVKAQSESRFTLIFDDGAWWIYPKQKYKEILRDKKLKELGIN